jgi:prepilin-type processing-associated H-X9-DG protein
MVIAIVGILAAFLLTAFVQSEGRAQRIYCANNVRQIGQAMQMYVADKHGYPLVAIIYPDHITGWMNSLSRSELNVPAHNKKPPFYPQPGFWHCPAAILPKGRERIFDYGFNSYGMSAQTDTKSLGLGGQHLGLTDQAQSAPPISESAVVSPSEMMAVGDGFLGGGPIISDGRWFLWRTYGLQEMPDDMGSTKRAYVRHQGRANVVFCDGHVGSPTLQFLFEDTSGAALLGWNRDHLPHREKLAP